MFIRIKNLFLLSFFCALTTSSPFFSQYGGHFFTEGFLSSVKHIPHCFQVKTPLLKASMIIVATLGTFMCIGIVFLRYKKKDKRTPPINLTNDEHKNKSNYFIVGNESFKVGDWIWLSDKFKASNDSRIVYGNCFVQIHAIHKDKMVTVNSYNNLSKNYVKSIEFPQGKFKANSCRKANKNEICGHVESVMEKTIPYIKDAIGKFSKQDVTTEFDKAKKLFDDPYCKNELGSCLSQKCQTDFKALEQLIQDS